MQDCIALNELRDSQARLLQLLTDSIRQLNISLLQMGDSSKDVLTFSANKDDTFHYVGEVKDNKAHGYGIKRMEKVYSMKKW